MKKFSSELAHNYREYSFGYCNYCIRERGDKLSHIYNAGYLPYSGNFDIKNTFYMARSARVPLDTFSLTSENRRVAGKFDGKFVRESIPIKKFDFHDEKFLSFCTDYFLKRHGPEIMPEERLKSILSSGLVTNVVVYGGQTAIKRPVAYVLECSHEGMTHFWFSFYDLNLIHKSLGMWLMIDSARYAKNEGKDYLYVGTVYGEKALYKTAFKNLEYWNGSSWITDISSLKIISRSDSKRSIGHIDYWKKEFH